MPSDWLRKNHRRRIYTEKRQIVVVSVWGASSHAALGIFGLNVQNCVHSCCTFPFAFVGGGGGGGMFKVAVSRDF